MKLAILAFCTLLNCISMAGEITAGEIKTNISDYDSLYLSNFGKEPRPFIGSFQFENVPIPAVPNKVHFTLEVINEGYYSNKDWTIKLDCFANTILLSDSSLDWPGKHEIGDKLEGDIIFMPYMAGYGGISIYLSEYFDYHCSGIAFGYCFDEDGILNYLDRWEMYPALRPKLNCSKYGFRNIFFNQDSIIIMDRHRGIPPYQPFQTRAVVKPIPKIGEKSTIYYTLKANQDLSEIGSTAFRFSNSKYIGVSSPEKLPMAKGDEISFAFEFIPELRAGMNGITFVQDCDAPNSLPNAGIMLIFHMIFDDNGMLKYCGDVNVEYPKEMTSTKAYQDRPAKIGSTITIMKDGKIIDGSVTRCGHINRNR